MKRAFTLIEIVISIFLTLLIVTFLYKSLAHQSLFNKLLSKKSSQQEKFFKITQLLFKDFNEAENIKIERGFEKSFYRIYLRTNNSLYQIPKPFVLYFVHKEDNTLVRLESPYPIKLPLTQEGAWRVYGLPLLKDIKKFEIFSSKKRYLKLLYIKTPKYERLFEFSISALF